MKGNLFLGMARGSVGDVVFARQKGQQTARARNRQPNNPRTTKQMSNRAKIATMVRFFSRSRQNLFNYAFEGKKGNQSDYNAFVSINSKNSPTNSFLAISQQWPMIGEYFLSQGTLSTPIVEYSSSVRNPSLQLTPLSQSVLPSAYTIGMLSQQLIDKYNYQNGDYLTFVVIRSQATPATTLEGAIEYKALTSRVINAEWIIKQMQIDTQSNALVSSLGIFIIPETTAATFGSLNYLDDSQTYTASVTFGTAVIASRVSPDNKVKTSTSQILVNAATKTACEIGKSLAWRTWVGENWEEQEQELLKANDILKGSISENEVNFNMPIAVTLNNQAIVNGQNTADFGDLVIDSLGVYDISTIEVYNNGILWTPTSSTGNSKTYNVQSNGRFEVKSGNDIIFAFNNNSSQDFGIAQVVTQPAGNRNVQSTGTYWQVPPRNTATKVGVGVSYGVTSAGADITSLNVTATNGTITELSVVGGEVRFKMTNNSNVGEPNSVYIGNVLVVYISAIEPGTEVASEVKATARAKAK